MKLYTKKGDKGQTSLLGGRRVSKSIVRLEVIGCLDELNAQLGLIGAKLKILEFPEKPGKDENKESNADASTDTNANADASTKPGETITKLQIQLERIQGELFEMGADVATTFSTSTSLQRSISRVPKDYIVQLETEIDNTDKILKPLKNFILPGGHEVAAELQVARAIARRAERNLVRLQKGAKINPHTLQYLNRLSDWLFAQARLVNHATETEESIWE